jgi:hypothetical protein
MTQEELFALTVRDLLADAVPEELIDLHRASEGVWTLLVAGRLHARITPLAETGRVSLTVFAQEGARA